jgi:hypothetical protein
MLGSNFQPATASPRRSRLLSRADEIGHALLARGFVIEEGKEGMALAPVTGGGAIRQHSPAMS